MHVHLVPDRSTVEPRCVHGDFLWARQDSNLRPRDYESPALTS